VRQFVRRNRLAVASAAIVIVGLSIGLIVAIAGWRESIQANQRTQIETSKLLQLAARQDLQDLEDEAQSLWPLSAELLPRVDSWIARAQRLVDDAPKHRATLAELDSGSTKAQVTEQEKHWWRRQVEMHLADLAEFADPERGLFTDAVNSSGVGVRRRAGLIRHTLALSTNADVHHAWEETSAYAHASPAYGDCELPSLFGLVPLGPDPASGLLEFYDARTGEAPRRHPELGIQLQPEHALVFVLVPPTLATLGAQVTDPAAPYYDVNASVNAETPPWRVQLSPFLISKFELTQAQWTRMDGRNPSAIRELSLRGEEVSGTRPVEMVSWDDSLRLLQRFGMTLPTAAQWEAAARGNTHTTWWCGSRAALETSENLYDLDGKAAGRNTHEPENWHDKGGKSTPVGRYKANPFGLYDVLGNVSEWCLDEAAHWALEPQPGRGLRVGPGSGSREVRGGSFATPALKARVSGRLTSPFSRRADVVGVRPVMLYVEDDRR
jgi:formylglycine-generating enzyme required for sulfatase activity